MNIRKAICGLIFGHSKTVVYQDNGVCLEECSICGTQWMRYKRCAYVRTVRTDF